MENSWKKYREIYNTWNTVKWESDSLEDTSHQTCFSLLIEELHKTATTSLSDAPKPLHFQLTTYTESSSTLDSLEWHHLLQEDLDNSVESK